MELHVTSVPTGHASSPRGDPQATHLIHEQVLYASVPPGGAALQWDERLTIPVGDGSKGGADPDPLSLMIDGKGANLA